MSYFTCPPWNEECSFCSRGFDLGGIIPYCATFTIFTDYMRGAIRIAALSQAGTIFVTTHDSIAATWV